MPRIEICPSNRRLDDFHNPNDYYLQHHIKNLQNTYQVYDEYPLLRITAPVLLPPSARTKMQAPNNLPTSAKASTEALILPTSADTSIEKNLASSFNLLSDSNTTVVDEKTPPYQTPNYNNKKNKAVQF